VFENNPSNTGHHVSVSNIKPEQITFGLPRERGVQLRALAAARGTTIVSVIEEVIARAVEAGEISDELKGFGEIIPDDDTLFVTIRGTALPALDYVKAITVAAMLDLAAGRPVPDLDAELKEDHDFLFGIGGDMVFGVTRYSRAVLIVIADVSNGDAIMQTSTTPSIASDFARLLRKHASTLAPSPKMSMLKVA
jgi:hypothetical protein